MKLIPIKNSPAPLIVDDADFEWVRNHSWNLSNGYLVATIKTKSISLHRLIMGAPNGIQVDHKNHNRLDCRRSNLRLATQTQQERNKPKTKRETSSKFKGVTRTPNGRWKATLKSNGKTVYFGTFGDEVLAAKIYDYFADLYFGEFAYFNFREGYATR